MFVCMCELFLPLRILSGTASYADDVEFCDLRDSSGATPPLGLLVANSEEATAVALEFYKNHPLTLLQQHSVDSPFAGEMAMHVLAVNQREETLMALVRLAHQNFDEKQLRILYTTTAHGAFFSGEPMIFYGGTVLGYFVAFGANPRPTHPPAKYPFSLLPIAATTCSQCRSHRYARARSCCRPEETSYTGPGAGPEVDRSCKCRRSE